MSDTTASKKWIGVDFDGTLAYYDGWKGASHCGRPIKAMVERVRGWLSEGTTVKIVTARVSVMAVKAGQADESRAAVQNWCRRYFGQSLDVVAEKDFDMEELWDDRAVCVQKNTGKVIVANSGRRS